MFRCLQRAGISVNTVIWITLLRHQSSLSMDSQTRIPSCVSMIFLSRLPRKHVLFWNDKAEEITKLLTM